MEAAKVQVKEGDVAIITCPLCKKSKKISVTKYKEIRKRDLRIKCSCAYIFSLCLEYRRYPRKPVRLLGKSINLSQQRENQDIIIKNISLGGIGFYPFRKHRTRKEDRLQVTFALSDYNNTSVEADATVRSAGGDYIGCAFNDAAAIKSSLGSYLPG